VPDEAESNRPSLGQKWTALPGAEQIEYIGEEKARGGQTRLKVDSPKPLGIFD
jgi:hypothetical protein